MKDSITGGEMTALLTVLLTAQWFSSTAAGYLDACGNAVWLAILLGGLLLAAIAILTQWLVPKDGLLSACGALKWAAPVFYAIGFCLFTLLGTACLRDTLTLLSLFLLPETRRIVFLLFLVPLLLAVCFPGLCAISRSMKLLAPVLLVLYLAVLVLSVWNQADLYHLTPLFGGGPVALLRTTLKILSVSAWLPLLWVYPLDKARKTGPHRMAPLLAAGISVLGYLFIALLFPGGALAESTYPLHRLSASGGFSEAFQRTNALFVFAWLPAQIAAVATALLLASKMAASCFPKVKNQRWFLPLPLLLACVMGFATEKQAPPWLNTLLATSTQALLACPLLIPLVISKIRSAVQSRKEANHA